MSSNETANRYNIVNNLGSEPVQNPTRIPNNDLLKQDKIDDSIKYIMFAHALYRQNFEPFKQVMSSISNSAVALENNIQKNDTDYSTPYTDGKNGDVMDDSKILELYIKKVDDNQNQMKEDMRESERRLTKSFENYDNKMNSRMDRIEKLISNQNITLENQNQIYNDKVDKLSDKFDVAVKDIKGNKIAIAGICIATILSVTAIITAAVQVVEALLPLIK